MGQRTLNIERRALKEKTLHARLGLPAGARGRVRPGFDSMFPVRCLLLQVLLLALVSCGEKPRPFDAAFVRLSAEEVAMLPGAGVFQSPLGGEQGALVYDAQPFRVTRHMGSDLNGIGGWNSDLGDPVFAAGTGTVIYAGVPGEGWGNMLIIAHRVPEPGAPRGWTVYETVYAHLEKVLVRLGDKVERGLQIGTVGTAGGKYLAHLHFEVRRSRSAYPGSGYSDGALDRVSPAEFLSAHGAGTEAVLIPAPRG
jgi:murein DD-endopeptidase MepM/ murein hydrolase activator NlpD